MNENEKGITSGVVFLGLVGNAGSRREYTVLGDKVNLAARLMGTAKKQSDVYGDVLCDESIRDSCLSSPYLMFIDRGTVELKGFEQPVPCFNPKQKVAEIKPITELSEDLLESGDSHLVSTLISAVEQMHKQGIGKIVFVEGEAGMGKSSLLIRAAKQTEARAWFLWGKGNFYHETQILLNRMAFPVWKQILKGFQLKFSVGFEQTLNEKSFSTK
ncbi:TPR repeat-containing protein [Reticulomyxa filosa]|uniref:TPR repeat-containing protein n=1 Tax=Reticulomyxa filosa TaxID=46433 RepID=X6NSY7_RETFI|nr:TPR repeat-containing protein [Reticulomyxa filosa]|eukprot:ETO28412.1 TPR repeat-containing protein [Reticulomyxa filosa]